MRQIGAGLVMAVAYQQMMVAYRRNMCAPPPGYRIQLSGCHVYVYWVTPRKSARFPTVVFYGGCTGEWMTLQRQLAEKGYASLSFDPINEGLSHGETFQLSELLHVLGVQEPYIIVQSMELSESVDNVKSVIQVRKSCFKLPDVFVATGLPRLAYLTILPFLQIGSYVASESFSDFWSHQVPYQVLLPGRQCQTIEADEVDNLLQRILSKIIE